MNTAPALAPEAHPTMSDMAAALSTDHADVPEFEGKRVAHTTVKVTKTGDGLSKELTLARQHLRHGQRVIIVMECVVDEVNHKTAKGFESDEEGAQLERRATLVAGRAYIADGPGAPGGLIDELEKGFRQQTMRFDEAETAAKAQASIDPGGDWANEDDDLDAEDGDEGMYGDGEGGTVHPIGG